MHRAFGRGTWWRPLLMGTCLVFCGCQGGSDPADATTTVPKTITVNRAFPGLSFDHPVALLPVPGDPGRWFVVEKTGRVQSFIAGTTDSQTVLDITDRVDAGPAEAGLLGFAFDPDYLQNGRVYVSYTRPGSPLTSYVSRFVSRGDGSIDATSEQPLLTLDQPFQNHNGGGIGFGPDGYLYIGFGDGGSAGDPQGNGQNTQTLLGGMLRIDVSGDGGYTIPPDNPFASRPGGRPELYAWGLRNPWRWSFDPPSGRLWVGDVGQDRREEIDIVVNGGNYGWNIREGTACYQADTCQSTGLIAPVAEYTHSDGCSITGGYVYRGQSIPALEGEYLFGDFCSGKVWGLTESGAGSWSRHLLANSGLAISSFAEGPDGELYLLDYQGGGIYRIENGS